MILELIKMFSCCFFFQEIIYAFQLRKYYVKDYESLLKWSMLIGAIIETMPYNSKLTKNISAITVLLAWLQLLLILGRNPKWGYYVHMFCKVVGTLIKVRYTHFIYFKQ